MECVFTILIVYNDKKNRFRGLILQQEWIKMTKF